MNIHKNARLTPIGRERLVEAVLGGQRHQLRAPGRPTWRCRTRLSWPFAWVAPLNRKSLHSAHIHGTHMPVEEPSTASGTTWRSTPAPMASTERDVTGVTRFAATFVVTTTWTFVVTTTCWGIRR